MNSPMIGSLTISNLAPLDYRYALDAAMTIVGSKKPLVLCHVPALKSEATHRINTAEDAGDSGLWIEPLEDTWTLDLERLTRQLPRGAPLVVIASRPLARRLPERRTWQGAPLGVRLGGIRRLHRTLSAQGFTIDQAYGIHTVMSIGISIFSQIAARRGRPDIADRLHFAARLHYCKSGPQAPLSTVALLIGKKERA